MKFIVVILTAIISTVCFAEKRVKIAVIDTGISISQAVSDFACANGNKSLIPHRSSLDKHGHGRNVFGLIAEEINPRTHCIISYKFWHDKKDGATSDEIMARSRKAFAKAIDDGVQFINYSAGGTIVDEEEFKLIAKALRKGITVIVAAGNEKMNLDENCGYFPACYKHHFKDYEFYVVGAHDVDTANTGSIVDFYEPGYKVGNPVLSGTSQATATFTGKLISGKIKKHGIIVYRRENGHFTR